MHDLTHQIDDMKARWMTGGTAEPACPAAWRDALGTKPDLTLLALAGQFTRVATAPSTGTLSARTPLPKLGLPTLPDDTRALFRRVLDGKVTNISEVLSLLEARGVTVHPADWMPKASTEVPDVYGPWIDWISQDGAGTDDDELTVENWDDWFPNARRVALLEMRRSAPAAARDLIAAKAGDVPAEQRLRLVSVLETGLGADDAELLETLTSDRSGKVAKLATSLLARLGKATASEDDIAELAAFFEVQRAGMLSRKQVVVARKLKTAAQKKRRWDLAHAVPLSALAGALGEDADQLVDMIEIADGIEEVVTMTAATGTAGQAGHLLARLTANAKTDIDLTPLAARQDKGDRKSFAALIAKHDPNNFRNTVDALGPTLGTLDAADLQSSLPYQTLQKHLKKDDGRVAQHVDSALTNLGLIASSDAAERLLTVLTTDFGLMAADPRLAMLRLNASLKET